MFSLADSRNFFASFVLPQVLDFLDAMKVFGQEHGVPNISWSTARFIYETCVAHRPKNILEIGPANGFSTMILGLIPDAHITSIEFSRHAFEELRQNIRTFDTLKKGEDIEDPKPAHCFAKVTSEIFQEYIGSHSLYFGDARAVLPAFEFGASELVCETPKSRITNIPQQRFDVIFIDGAFRMTREFFDLSRPLLAENGVVILDDAIKFRWKMD